MKLRLVPRVRVTRRLSVTPRSARYRVNRWLTLTAYARRGRGRR